MKDQKLYLGVWVAVYALLGLGGSKAVGAELTFSESKLPFVKMETHLLEKPNLTQQNVRDLPNVDTSDRHWMEDDKTGCKIWNSTLNVGDTLSWNGACNHGIASGKGTAIWYLKGKLNFRNDGEYIDGRLNGHATEDHANGDHFEGEYVNGMANGIGIYTAPNGMRFVGMFRDDKQNGKGIRTFKDGERDEGTWRDGKMDGYFVIAWPNKERFEGEYVEDRPTRGVYIKANGRRYRAVITKDEDVWTIAPGDKLP